ncbi:MAG: ABC transporter permease [Cyclobacteriaceae bacterium]
MLLNYLKLAIRLLIRNPFFTFINVLGLSVGFAVFFILSQHSSYELRSDQFHKDHERIYRLYFDFYHNTGVDWTHYLGSTFAAVFTTMVKEKFAEIESTTRIIHQNNFDQVRWAGPETDTAGWRELNPTTVFSFITDNNEKHSFIETNTVYADPNLFQFFSLPLLIGSPHNVLSKADAIVLSASTARKYFGEVNPIGKVLTLGENESFTVTGVFRDLPKNTHLNFDLVLSTLRIQYAIENVHPLMRSAQNYFKVREETSVADLENKMNEEQKKHWDLQGGFPGSTLTVYLQPLKEAPFHVFDNDVFTPKSKYIAHTFRVIAIIVLLMAWINYLNLKLSMQAARMKELAARKTAGASRIDFIKQFLIESLVINGMALVTAFTLIQLLTYPLETLFQFYLPAWNEITLSSMMLFLAVMSLGILIAGLQPGFSVWGMTTQKILGHRKLVSERSSFAQITTVFQFVSAIALIVWLFSISKQVNFVTNDAWGIERHQVVVVELPLRKSLDLSTGLSYESEVNSLKNVLRSTPGIEDMALSTTVAGDLFENPIRFSRMDTANVGVASKSNGGVDERFIPFYGLRLISGRNFIADHPADRRSVILSRLAAKTIGLKPENAIGKILFVGKHPWKPFGTNAEIIGVIEDYRYNPLYLETGIANANRGTILTYGDYLFAKNKPLKMSLRVNIRNITEVIARIEKKYLEIFPGQIFHWYFLNDHMNAHYKTENIARNQILLFTILAVGIACLGLVGMISNKMVEKTKEIGIRKILGAKLGSLLQILLNTTIKQILVGTVIGIPLAYFITDEYLEKFSERISIHWWHYLLPLTILLVIMFMTISTLLWKAVRTNPVDSLRYE